VGAQIRINNELNCQGAEVGRALEDLAARVADGIGDVSTRTCSRPVGAPGSSSASVPCRPARNPRGVRVADPRDTCHLPPRTPRRSYAKLCRWAGVATAQPVPVVKAIRLTRGVALSILPTQGVSIGDTRP
jgi:hypothetical protein